MLNLGVRAHDFGRRPAGELAARIAAHGLSCIQLAPGKALTEVAADAVPDFATARRLAAAFRAQGIQVAVLGCYINLAVRDEALRRPQLERFKQHLRLAPQFGCSVVGTETGSLHADFSRHPDNGGEEAFAIVRESVRELVREAEQCGVNVGIEAVERYVISSPRRLRRLLDEIGSPRLQVILDPVNLLAASNHEAQDDILREALDLLGDAIAIIHAKDFAMRDGVFEERPAGAGTLRYGALLRWLKQRRPGIPVLLENTTPDGVAASIRHLREEFARS
jgi:sugar phosphate isomerase/epimerase